MIDAVKRAVVWVRGFAEIRAPQSMTRLCAFIFAVVGASCGMAGTLIALLAFRAHRLEGVADLIKALALLAAAFVTSGAVALLTRTRPKGDA